MSADDLTRNDPPVGEHTAAEQERTPAQEEKPKLGIIPKLIGIGALIAGGVWLFKRKGGHGGTDPGVAI